MRDEETMMYRRPLPYPSTGYYEGIMIDDHLGIQLLERRSSIKQTLEQSGRDLEAFDLAREAYQHANLEAHEKKKVRRSMEVKAWGAELEGWQGLVGPVRSRLFKLAKLSVSVAAPGPVDEKIVESITGLWAFCAQFRRPMFSFLHALYHQQSPGSSSSPFRLTREARNELLVLACLSPLCITDVTTIPDEFIYCVDASPSGANDDIPQVIPQDAQPPWQGIPVGSKLLETQPVSDSNGVVVRFVSTFGVYYSEQEFLQKALELERCM